MKRIYNYILFKINSSKLIAFSTILIIYQFSLLLYLNSRGQKYNIYDFIMHNFSYLSLFYSVNLFFLVMIYNIFDKDKFYNYLNIRFNSKQEVYRANVLTALIFSIGIVIFINIICILSGSFMNFSNTWSPYFIYKTGVNLNLFADSDAIKIIMHNLTPISLVLLTNLLVILYLFLISIFFIVCNIIFKKRAISFILVIVLNILSTIFDTGNLSFLAFSNNIYIINSGLNEVTNGTYIISKFIYWLVLIILMYFIGFILTKKKDCNYGD